MGVTRRRRGGREAGRWPAFRRCLSAGLAAVLAAAVLVQPALGEDAIFPPDLPRSGPAGTIVAPHGAGLLYTDVVSGSERTVGILPAVGVAGHASWSPDGSQVAISRFGRRPGERVGGSDIMVVPASGGELQPVAEHAADGALLGAPTWTPDGAGLYFDHLPPAGAPADSRVEFAALGATDAARFVSAGSWPAVSRDGRYLAYVRPSPVTGDLNELVIASVDGSAERVLVPADELVQITSPRFSPDDTEIAFVGSLTRGEDEPAAALLTGLFAKGLTPGGLTSRGVMAHGPPGDVWLTSLYGGAPRKLTSFEEDEPTLAWSPDGTWLAMFGGGGLYLVARDESSAPYRLSRGGFGGIDWR